MDYPKTDTEPLRLARQILSVVLNQTAEAIVITGGDGKVVAMSRAAEALLAWPEATKEALLARLAGLLDTKSELIDGRLPTCDGDNTPLILRRRGLDEAGAGAGPGQASVAWLINRKAASGQDGIDMLTGLPDRTIFHDRLQQALINAERAKKSVAVLLVGVDRLAMINDALSSAAGDRVLVKLSERLCQCLRASDAVTRLDGDIFGLVLAITSQNDSVLVAEKIFQALARPFHIDGQELLVTVSIGIALYPADAGSLEKLITKAESALRYAKSNGRNQYQFVSGDMNRRARHRLELEGRLRHGLQRNEFVVYYQPKVSAETAMVVGMEALVRWQDPERGLVPPGEFIPVAEETGLIEQIGAFVLAESCRQNVQWQQEGLPALRVSVNVSARQFRARSMVERVERVLADSGLSPSLLELEITESLLMDNIDQTLDKLSALRKIGVGISLDDFGTGYSSLSYLAQFPISTLKIDRSFVFDVQNNHKTAEITRAIIGLSKGLQLEVIAEGAEVFEHVQFLKDHGCDLIQGYYFSRPLPATAFAELVRRGAIVRPAAIPA